MKDCLKLIGRSWTYFTYRSSFPGYLLLNGDAGGGDALEALSKALRHHVLQCGMRGAGDSEMARRAKPDWPETGASPPTQNSSLRG